MVTFSINFRFLTTHSAVRRLRTFSALLSVLNGTFFHLPPDFGGAESYKITQHQTADFMYSRSPEFHLISRCGRPNRRNHFVLLEDPPMPLVPDGPERFGK